MTANAGYLQAIERAKMHQNPFLKILLATVGVIFLGAPLRSGPKLTKAGEWYTLFQGMLSKKPSDGVMKDLTRNTGVLRELLGDFARTANNDWLRLQIRCFYETKETEKRGYKDFVSILNTGNNKPF